MAILRTEVHFPFTSSLPRDVSINALHWSVDGTATNTGNHEDIASLIDDFYNAPPAVGLALSKYFSSVISRAENAAVIKFYDAEADPQPLLNEIRFSVLGTPESDTNFPNEIAVCLSLTATPGTPVPQRRRRGRVYFGPINAEIVGTRTSGGEDIPSVTTEARQAFADRCENMATQDDFPFVAWGIWSTVNEALYVVSGGFIDNDFDIQRRREVDATARTIWGAPFP